MPGGYMELDTTGDIAMQDQVAYTLPVGLGYRSAWTWALYADGDQLLRLIIPGYSDLACRVPRSALAQPCLLHVRAVP
jgi:hypothetical protein